MAMLIVRLLVAEPLSGASYSAVELSPDNDKVWTLEQRRLPEEEVYVEMTSVGEVADGIRDMVVRGAPAIGIAAAYGMVLAAVGCAADHSSYLATMTDAGEGLCKTRPTAVNLRWAVDCVLDLVRGQGAVSHLDRVDQVAELARRIHREDVEACKTMGRLGASCIRDGKFCGARVARDSSISGGRGVQRSCEDSTFTVLTHCNAGALATGGYGTALGVIRAVRDAGIRVRVLADETRPYMQGARLTAWELHRDGIDVEVITDNMAAHFFRWGTIDLVVVGADRVARNGDVANKIGTYGVACLAKMHDVPFWVAAPVSTVDVSCPRGESIPIEERDQDEVAWVGGRRFVPVGVRARYPGFDVTPAGLVTAILTERGIVAPVCEAGVVGLGGIALEQTESV